MTDTKKQSCQVCGVKIGAESYALEYNKMMFHFCSTQCCETFRNHPALYSQKQPGAHDEILKRRHLRLARPSDAATAKQIREHLLALKGMREVDINGNLLTLRYDLRQVTLLQIERALHESDVALNDGWWQKLRRAWARDTEQNLLDNLAAPSGACCNRPPPRT